MRFFFVGLSLLNGLRSIGQLATLPLSTDSTTVTVVVPKGDRPFLYYWDAYGGDVFLTSGPNRVPRGTVIMDPDGRGEVFFWLRTTAPVKLVKPTAAGRFVAQSSDPQLNSELNYSVAYRKKYPTSGLDERKKLSYVETTHIRNTALREKLLLNDHQQRLTFLNDYATQHMVTNEFVRFWKENYRYEYLTWRFQAVALAKPPIPWRQTYLDSLKALRREFNDDPALRLPHYLRGVSNLSFHLAKPANSRPRVTIVDRYTAIRSHFSGQTRDWLLTRLVTPDEFFRQTQAVTQAQLDTCLAWYFSDCQTEFYTTYVREVTDAKKQIIPAGSLVNLENQVVEFRTLTDEAKVTYVDFWASWCAPCRAEMPDSKRLKAEFEKRGVKFLYISLDDNPVAWKRASQQIGLSTEESFLAPKARDSELIKQFRVLSIPRYLILGQGSKVISASAPRPSDATVRSALNAALGYGK